MRRPADIMGASLRAAVEPGEAALAPPPEPAGRWSDPARKPVDIMARRSPAGSNIRRTMPSERKRLDMRPLLERVLGKREFLKA